MSKHFVQTESWCSFKSKYGTPCVNTGGVFYTKHKVPGLPYYVAYCPRVDPTVIDFPTLSTSLRQNNCIYINFDVPNVIKGTHAESVSQEIFSSHNCLVSKKTTFATANVLLDISQDSEALLANMHPKRRYNIKLSQKMGVIVKEGSFEDFWKLLNETATLQKFFLHPKRYYQLIWDELGPSGQNIAKILCAYKDETPLAAWMLFVDGDTLYYPYGGSSELSGKYHASELLGWEVILFGKKLGCTKFDMWGAADNPTDTTNSYFGFTQFKLRFGGMHVKYMDSYDYVLNKPVYDLFNFVNKLRWLVLRFLK